MILLWEHVSLWDLTDDVYLPILEQKSLNVSSDVSHKARQSFNEVYLLRSLSLRDIL